MMRCVQKAGPEPGAATSKSLFFTRSRDGRDDGFRIDQRVVTSWRFSSKLTSKK